MNTRKLIAKFATIYWKVHRRCVLFSITLWWQHTFYVRIYNHGTYMAFKILQPCGLNTSCVKNLNCSGFQGFFFSCTTKQMQTWKGRVYLQLTHLLLLWCAFLHLKSASALGSCNSFLSVQFRSSFSTYRTNGSTWMWVDAIKNNTGAFFCLKLN